MSFILVKLGNFLTPVLNIVLFNVIINHFFDLSTFSSIIISFIYYLLYTFGLFLIAPLTTLIFSIILLHSGETTIGVIGICLDIYLFLSAIYFSKKGF